jgi:hypothetical protein
MWQSSWLARVYMERDLAFIYVTNASQSRTA